MYKTPFWNITANKTKGLQLGQMKTVQINFSKPVIPTINKTSQWDVDEKMSTNFEKYILKTEIYSYCYFSVNK